MIHHNLARTSHRLFIPRRHNVQLNIDAFRHCERGYRSTSLNILALDPLQTLEELLSADLLSVFSHGCVKRLQGTIRDAQERIWDGVRAGLGLDA